MKTNVWAYALISFLTSLLAVSCHDDSDVLCSTFSKVEKCMDSYPDSALNLLKSIPNPEELRGKSQADYALLMTQAMDKNYVKFTSDSLIEVALNYYTVDQRDPHLRAKTEFYYGRVLLELDRQEEALKSLLAAKTYYNQTLDYKMMALISDEIGMINRIQAIYKAALENFQTSLSLYKQVRDSLCIVRAYQNIGRIHLYQNEWDSCSTYFGHALKIAQYKKYNSEASILHDFGIMYRSKGDLNKAEYYFLASFKKETGEDKKYMECLSLGYLYLQMGKVNNARRYLELSLISSNAYTKIDAYKFLCYLEKTESNFEKAIFNLEKADSLDNSMEEINSRELIADLQKKYENEKLQKENLQIKVRYTNFVLWGTVAFLILVFYLCYYYYKNRINKKRIIEIECQIRVNEENIAQYQYEIEEIYASKEQMKEENRTKIGELNGKIMILTMQNKTLSEKLNNLDGEITIEVKSEHFIPTFRLLLAIKEGTFKGKLTSEDRERVLGLFDFLYLNYVSRLREKYNSLTKHDLEICCLLKLGLTHEELSCIFNTTSDSVTRAKGRLKGRLKLTSYDDLELFLRNF